MLDGALEHRDSLGNGSIIRPGDPADERRHGDRHSEFNQSKSDAVHFLQIWIIPERAGLPADTSNARSGHGARRADPDRLARRRDGSVTIHQDAAIHAAQLTTGTTVERPLPPDGTRGCRWRRAPSP